MYLPRGAQGRRPPVVMMLHGGPTAQARPTFDPVKQYLLARGYAVLDLNFRGSTGYGQRFTQLDNGRLRPNAVRDMQAAVEYLRGRADVDGGRVAAMGGSYGGYMTLAAVAQLPEYFQAGVDFVGVANWISGLEDASPQLKNSDRIEYGNIDDPADRAFFTQISPLSYADQIRSPLMVVHGANDPRVPVGEADQIVRAVRGRRGDVEYLRFPDEGHGIAKLQNRITAYQRIARFLDRVLGNDQVVCRGR
jgi:dipeptidyl aminopeptidase/acylaminoacyl peptidase